MKSPLPQSELSARVNAGETVLVKFRHAYKIVPSYGVGEYILSPIGKKAHGLPYTKAGRFQCVTPEYFRKLQSY